MPTITRKDLFAQIKANPSKRQQVRSALGSQWNRKGTEAIARAVGLQVTTRKSIEGAAKAKATAKQHGFAKSFAAENASKHLNGDKEQLKAQILKAINRNLKKAEKSKGDKLSREEKRSVAAKSLKNEVLRLRQDRPNSLNTKALKWQRSPITKGDRSWKQVQVSVADLDKAWNHLRVEKGGKGGIGDRYEQAKKFLSSNSKINMIEATARPDGSIVFIDGRHRFAALRDAGVKTIPVLMRDSKHWSVKNSRA